MIDVYYWPTPNGWKVTIMLEDAGRAARVGAQLQAHTQRLETLGIPVAGHFRERDFGAVYELAEDARDALRPDCAGRVCVVSIRGGGLGGFMGP